jgi:ketosteroid isomerase-like protein
MTQTVTGEAMAVVRDFYAKFADRETFPQALALFDDDNFVMSSPPGLPWGGEYRGRNGFLKLAKHLTSLVTPGTEGELEFIDGGDWVIVRAVGGSFTSVASGESVHTPVIELWKVRDAKIVELDVYYKDPAAVTEMVA